MRTLSVIALAGWLCVSATSALASNLEFGLAKAKEWSSLEHRDLMVEYGADDFAGVYWNVLSPDNLKHPFDWIRDHYLHKGCKPVIVTLLLNGVDETSVDRSELSQDPKEVIGNHADIIAGKYDEPVLAFAKRLKKAMKQSGCNQLVTINLMHEADGSWDIWGMDAKNNSAESYAKAYIHVVELFRSVEAPVEFQLNLNRRDGKFKVMRLIDVWFPLLDPYVDRYAISSYNRCGTIDSATEYRTFQEEFEPAYAKLAFRTPKPIDVAETSTSTLCGTKADKLRWFEEMISYLKKWAPQTERIMFYFGTLEVGDASNDVATVWGFPTIEGKAKFRAILNDYRSESADQTTSSFDWSLPTSSFTTAAVSGETASDDLAMTESESFESYTEPSDDGLPLGLSRAPWSIWMRFSHPFSEEENPAINTVTGNSFGERGSIVRFTATQQARWKLSDSLEFGPGLTFNGVFSENNDRWWDNNLGYEYTGGVYWKVPREFASWGTVSLEVFAGRKDYYADTPSRLDNGEKYFGARVGLNIGGDWLRNY